MRDIHACIYSNVMQLVCMRMQKAIAVKTNHTFNSYMQCLRRRSLDQFFNGIQSEPVKLAVVGCGCSVATEPVAEISHRWNITQVIKLTLSSSLWVHE